MLMRQIIKGRSFRAYMIVDDLARGGQYRGDEGRQNKGNK